MEPAAPTARIEFGRTVYDTKIFVDGEDITKRIPCQAIKVNATADVLGQEMTKLTIPVLWRKRQKRRPPSATSNHRRVR